MPRAKPGIRMGAMLQVRLKGQMRNQGPGQVCYAKYWGLYSSGNGERYASWRGGSDCSAVDAM